MPLFGGHHRSSSSTASSSAQQNVPGGVTANLLQAAQILGSVGTPSAATASTRTTGAATATAPAAPPPASAYRSRSPTASSHAFNAAPAQPAAQPPNHSPAQTNLPSNANAMMSNPAAPNNAQHFETPRRQQAYARHPDELHMGDTDTAAAAAQKGPLSPRDYGPGGAPRINLEQATPETSNYQSNLPGPLQSGGGVSRPPTLSSNSTPAVPALQSNMPADPFATPLRSNQNLSHNYSRSSPSTAYDGQPYQPYTTTPGGGSELSQFSTPSSLKYVPGQQRNVSNTPLGLADIRPRADSTLSDAVLPGANPYSYDGANAVPTNSNYLAPWAIYAFDWCKWPSHNNDAGKVAVGSYLEDGHNFIQILETSIKPSSPEPYSSSTPKYGLEFSKIAEATHSYPVTRLLWEPPSSQKQSTDLLATSGDHLRLWSLPADISMSSHSNSITRSSNHGQSQPSKLTPLALLSNSKTPEHTAPLTSLDWNTVSPSLIITSSIDTTCTIWDIPTLTAKTQLIAHDKEVFDVRFCANSVDVFVSCGADGSVRMFDLRSLEHSTIIYEPTAKDDKDHNTPSGRISPTLAQQTMAYAPPLLRLAASPHDTHLLATFSQDSKIIRILDVRQPGQALLELHGHAAAINCIEWSPSRRGTLASGADDSLVLVWDLLNANPTQQQQQQGGVNGVAPGAGPGGVDNIRSPTASWRCDYEVGNLSWAPNSALGTDGSETLGVSGGRGIWGVKF
ncbi:hypothetical protein VF21_06369 [Pseudogymnoascus sp. 05NY08]|nr:hypothetical protein VF21_06369 [Pseudogymnoascus sp. 05NY08]